MDKDKVSAGICIPKSMFAYKRVCSGQCHIQELNGTIHPHTCSNGTFRKDSCDLLCFETRLTKEREISKQMQIQNKQSPSPQYRVFLLACSDQFRIPLRPPPPNSPPLLHKGIPRASNGLPNGFFNLGRTCTTG